MSPWRMPPLGLIHLGDTFLPTRKPIGPRKKDMMTNTHCLGSPACWRKASSINWVRHCVEGLPEIHQYPANHFPFPLYFVHFV